MVVVVVVEVDVDVDVDLDLDLDFDFDFDLAARVPDVSLGRWAGKGSSSLASGLESRPGAVLS